MIYEYPEEFVVPVIYVDNLSGKSRDFELEYLQVDDGIVPDTKLQQHKGFFMNDYEDNVYEKKGEKFLKFDMDLLEEPYKKNMVSYNIGEDNLESNHVKEILKDIDNEYAKSETLSR